MENVVAFNTELSGLYETKPPISKAKMAAITKSAMRAIKFYKHVVQSVEKFILKCKPEYKVPGLYVIDSIVRQSRHQYGAEKDVFAPRFARNIKDTFANLFRCAPEDKGRIIRVLNLWQKNNVFAAEVIQPIFDLADPNHPIYQMPPGGVASAPSGSGGVADMSSSSANGLNASVGPMDISLGNVSVQLPGNDDKLSTLPDLSNNNLKQLLNDPNVLRQLQTLQNFQKLKQQEDKQLKLNEMRLQEEAFEKHLQNVLKASSSSGGQDVSDFSKEVEFISEEQKIEVINLDGNDSRSPSVDRDRYKRRRSRTRSRSRDRSGRDRDRRRRSRSRSRTRSPRPNRRRVSRERDRNERSTRDKERDREHERERRKKGLPDIKKEHLSVCSTTLWVGHLSKLVYQEELSDTFGEYGDIVSIDQIVPRGCAFIVMNRRQDAHRAMQSLKNHKLQGRAITISWAAGKGVKSKEWKDFWDLELGVTYIPWNKLDESTDIDNLEEGGMFDEDSMPSWMKDKINHTKSLKEKNNDPNCLSMHGGTMGSGSGPSSGTGANSLLFGIDTTQPPPGPPPTGGPPPIMSMVPGQYSIAPPITGPPRMLGAMGMALSGIPMPPNLVPGMPPPHPMMMSTGMLPPPGFPPIPNQVSGGPGMGAPHLSIASSTAQFPPPAVGTGGVASTTNMSNMAGDDQMDIEMDEDDSAPQPSSVANQQLNFSQPPPMFATGINAAAGSSGDLGVESFSRERNRNTGGGSRWGGRGVAGEDDAADDLNRWRDNSNNNGPPIFNDGRGVGRSSGPMNIPPLDLNNPPQRPEFMNDFDNRGGPRGPLSRGSNHNGTEFFANMQNRFNQPTSLLQMRIPPPNTFNPCMGGPPMFMRPPGARQQGPGPGFFNPRNPFADRDNARGGGRGGGGGGRGGGRGGRGNGHGSVGNWSDDDGDDGNNFKRRGQGGGNRFRDRDGSDDRFNQDRGGRRGGAGNRDRFDRDRDHERERDRDRGGSSSGNRNNPRDDSKAAGENPKSGTSNNISDTEEDWDRELQEYDGGPNSSNSSKPFDNQLEARTNNDEPIMKENDIVTNNNTNDNEQIEMPIKSNDIIQQSVFEENKNEPNLAASTPLYDEVQVPAPPILKAITPTREEVEIISQRVPEVVATDETVQTECEMPATAAETA